MLTGVRAALADDVDTPRALSLVDEWAEEALSAGGDDPTGPALAAATVDGLLGIRL
jgi:L-cysteine:1D-myo-inositol 2-amino-2-deoxy-alpha-D-glucopyranoside ligase